MGKPARVTLALISNGAFAPPPFDLAALAV